MGCDFLKRSSRIYEKLRDRVMYFSKKNPHVALRWVRLAAEWAWMNHAGRYADGGIENAVLSIGESLERYLNSSKRMTCARYAPIKITKGNGRRAILHVATCVTEVGGHTRLLRGWIENDPDSCHSLLVIDQGNNRIPRGLCESVQRSGGFCIALPSVSDRLLKAKWLREISQQTVDLVVSHHHPDDVVPILAYATRQCPPIAILNHADHVFWLGGSVADVVISFRKSGKILAEKRRFVRHSMMLPIPLIPSFPSMTKTEARGHLKITDQQMMLLSMGSAYKYIPTDVQNFFSMAIRILEENLNAHMYIIGPAKQDIRHLPALRHKRIHLLGEIVDPLVYCTAADIYLEGFPLGSTTAFLETAALGTCPVLALAPNPSVLSTDDLALEGIIGNAPNENVYVQEINFLIRNESRRKELGSLIKKKIMECHTGEKWQLYLKNTYGAMEALAHEPCRLPETECMETYNDLSLANVNWFRNKDGRWRCFRGIPLRICLIYIWALLTDVCRRVLILGEPSKLIKKFYPRRKN